LLSAKYCGKELTLQHSNLAGLEAATTFYGATCGRVSNRILDSKFTLNGVEVKVDANTPPHSLHGGADGWSQRVWRVGRVAADSVEFLLHSPDGESGYVGAVDASCTYTLAKDSLDIAWKCALAEGEARSTHVNVVNHAYWNLSGDLVQDIKGHTLWAPRCATFVAVDDALLPTGAIANVAGTPYDFRAGATEDNVAAFEASVSAPGPLASGVVRGADVGAAIAASDGGGGRRGVDHCLCVDRAGVEAGALALVAVVRCGDVAMTVRSTQPGCQIYTSNFLADDAAAAPHTLHRAMCLETQHYPDSPNRPQFPEGTLLAPGGEYSHRVVHAFFKTA